jgi:hypothetical protein
MRQCGETIAQTMTYMYILEGTGRQKSQLQVVADGMPANIRIFAVDKRAALYVLPCLLRPK